MYYVGCISVNGGWSNWGDWGACSRSCGGGTKHRSRNCDNPSPQYGGSYCHGDSSNSDSCNTDDCGKFIQRLNSILCACFFFQDEAKVMFSSVLRQHADRFLTSLDTKQTKLFL